MSSQVGHPELPDGAERVLRFWFLELTPGDWFGGSNSLDRIVTERFGDTLAAAEAGRLDGWAQTPRGLLALVIVLDQFSRHVHSGTSRAYAQDPVAQALVQRAIDRGDTEQLGLDERQFLYMPLMHAEDRKLQALGVEKFESLVTSAEKIVGFARAHRDIVDRFGRFPYRNGVLERESTSEEREFIDREGNPFD
ncbi:MAG: DUF924 family protein [Erythrobacter sp.]